MLQKETDQNGRKSSKSASEVVIGLVRMIR